MTEAEWQKMLVKSAVQLGWDFLHIGRNGKHQKVGAKGTLGRGWPDLTLVKNGRLLFIECKAEGAPPPPQEQKDILALLSTIPGAQVLVARPRDFNMILDVLAGGT